MALLRRELGLEAKIWLLTASWGWPHAGRLHDARPPIGTGPSELDVPWWLVAAGFAAAERWVVHLHFRRSTHSLSLGELPLVAGLLFLPAHELVLAGLVGVVGGARLRPRDPDLQGLLQPRAVHARHVCGAVRGRGLRERARPARPDGLALRLRRGLGRHAGRRHLRGRGRDDRGGHGSSRISASTCCSRTGRSRSATPASRWRSPPWSRRARWAGSCSCRRRCC